LTLVIAQDTARELIPDETETPDGDNCFQRGDGGVFAKVPGSVLIYRFIYYPSTTYDTCVGRKGQFGMTKIREFFCNEDGNRKAQVMGEEELGEGYCIEVGEGRDKIAKWIPLEPSCEETTYGAVNQREEKFITGCYINDKREIRGGAVTEEKPFVHIKYTCNEDGTQQDEIVTNCVEAGAITCSHQLGCIGICEDTDPENDKTISGKVTSDGTEFNDVCEENRVRQYQCNRRGKAAELPLENCGATKQCQEGRCIDKFVGVEDIPVDLNSRIDELTNEVNILKFNYQDLLTRVGTLESESAVEVSSSPPIL
jgi:hypothetical protein